MLDALHFLIPFVTEFLFEPVMPGALQAIGPVTGSLLASAGSSLIGAGVDKLFNDGPDVPDLVAETKGRFQNQRRQLSDQTDENVEQVQADAAASGADPLSATAKVIDSNNEALASLSAKEADAVARAKNQMKKMKFDKERREAQATSQGIGSITNALSQAATSRAMNMDEGGDFFGGLFGGDGSSSSGTPSANAIQATMNAVP